MKIFGLFLYVVLRIIFSFAYLLLCIGTAMVGYTKHHSLFWAFLDFWFTPLTLVYWLVTKQINISLIKETFAFLFQ